MKKSPKNPAAGSFGDFSDQMYGFPFSGQNSQKRNKIVDEPADGDGNPHGLNAPAVGEAVRNEDTEGQIREVREGKDQHVSGRPQNCVGTAFQADKQKEERFKADIGGSDRERFGSGGSVQKSAQEGGTEYMQDDAQKDSDRAVDQVAGFVGLFHPFRLSRSEILRGKGGHGVSDGGHGDDTDGFDPHAGSVSGHHGRAEAVDDHLYQKHSDVYNGLLKYGRNSNLHHFPADFSAVQGCADVFRVLGSQSAHKQQKRDNRGNSLGNQGSDGDSENAQVKDNHKGQVEEDIQNRRKNQQIQRCPGISHGVENGSQGVIHK